MKIKFKNFQALRSEEIELNPGFTLITGPTDNGKTAIFRGLLSLLTNSVDAPSFINGTAIKEQGENAELAVTIIDDDIPKIEFHRNQAKAWYMIDGKKYSKLARSNIFDIYPDLHKKFVYSATDPTRKIMNFQTEEQGAFPFDRSDAEMFKLFEQIFNISDTRAVIDTMRKEEEETNFKLTQHATEKKSLEDKIQALRQGLVGANKELLLAYAENYKQCFGSVQSYAAKLNSIISRAPYLKAAQLLPEMTKQEDSICNATMILAEKLQKARLKSNYIANYVDIQLSPINEDLESQLSVLAAKVQQILNLDSALTSQKQIIQKNEEICKAAEKELSEFNICPLCGHELGEN